MSACDYVRRRLEARDVVTLFIDVCTHVWTQVWVLDVRILRVTMVSKFLYILGLRLGLEHV